MPDLNPYQPSDLDHPATEIVCADEVTAVEMNASVTPERIKEVAAATEPKILFAKVVSMMAAFMLVTVGLLSILMIAWLLRVDPARRQRVAIVFALAAGIYLTVFGFAYLFLRQLLKKIRRKIRIERTTCFDDLAGRLRGRVTADGLYFWTDAAGYVIPSAAITRAYWHAGALHIRLANAASYWAKEFPLPVEAFPDREETVFPSTLVSGQALMDARTIPWDGQLAMFRELAHPDQEVVWFNTKVGSQAVRLDDDQQRKRKLWGSVLFVGALVVMIWSAIAAVIQGRADLMLVGMLLIALPASLYIATYWWPRWFNLTLRHSHGFLTGDSLCIVGDFHARQYRGTDLSAFQWREDGLVRRVETTTGAATELLIPRDSIPPADQEKVRRWFNTAASS
jgi:hypothetical protein